LHAAGRGELAVADGRRDDDELGRGRDGEAVRAAGRVAELPRLPAVEAEAERDAVAPDRAHRGGTAVLVVREVAGRETVHVRVLEPVRLRPGPGDAVDGGVRGPVAELAADAAPLPRMVGRARDVDAPAQERRLLAQDGLDGDRLVEAAPVDRVRRRGDGEPR